MDLVNEFTHTVLLTGRVAGAAPVSAFLIAEPESGKTSITCDNHTEGVVALTKCTAMGLELTMQMHPRAHHLILSDLTFVTGMSPRASKSLFEMLKASIEEGLQNVADPSGFRKFSGQRIGIIGCATPSLAKDNRSWWWKHGFASRVVPFCYHYSDPLVIRIKQEILDGKAHDVKTPEKPPRTPELPIHVKLETRFANIVLQISNAKAIEMESRGIRLLKQMMALVKAHSLLRGWKNAAVTEDDIAFLKRVYPYMNWNKPCIL